MKVNLGNEICLSKLIFVLLWYGGDPRVSIFSQRETKKVAK